MRRLLVFLLLAPIILCAAPKKKAPWQLSLGTDLGYDTNVFALSDSDIDKFDDGNTNFSFAESSDDMIISPSAKLSHDWKWRRITFTPSVQGDYTLYTSNSDKSKWSALTAIEGQYRKWDAKVWYGYYPENYVRDYKDRDGSGANEPYKYDKDLFKGRVQYDVLKHDTAALSGKYEIYRYNEYFTEYDGEAITLGGEWTHSFPGFYLTGGYQYRTYDCNELSAQQIEDDLGDGSYESNLYSVELQNKKIRIAHRKYIRPGISFDFEDRYYQTNRQDAAHADRHDRKYTLTAQCSFLMMQHTEWVLAFTQTRRDADSDYNPRQDQRLLSRTSLAAFAV
jgi:hypothetical protein